MWDWAYPSNCKSNQAKILYGHIKHMKMYYGKYSGQIEFINILFIGLKLLNKSYQIYQTRTSCIIWKNNEVASGVLLWFKLG